jgi:hypothetical protein
MKDTGRLYWDFNANNNNPILLLASTQEGQPAVQLIDRRRHQEASLDNTAVANRESVSVLLEAQEPAAAFWPATLESAGSDVRLRPYYFPAVEQIPFAAFRDGEMVGLRAAGFQLEEGSKRLDLTIGNSIVAVLSKGNAIERTLWRGGLPFHVVTDTVADRLTLLHMRAEDDRYTVESIPLPPEEMLPALQPGELYARNHIRSGIEKIDVRVPKRSDNAPPFKLHIRGGFEEIVFFAGDGQVLHGADFIAPEGKGSLGIEHQSGLLLCWLDQEGQEAQGLWPAKISHPKPELISLPAMRKLNAAVESYQFKINEPVLLQARTSAPSISFLKRSNDPPEASVHPNNTYLEVYLPVGTSQLDLRSIEGAAFSTSIEFTKTPVTPIGEGLGPEVLLAPGDSRLFSFEVKQQGPVGVGVRASSDVIESELITEHGQSLGKGTIKKYDLKPGVYLLALRAPAQGQPVRAKPAVVGIVPPDTGPPEEIIREYLGPEEPLPRFTSSRAQAPVESEGYDESEQEGVIEESESPEEEQ